jgi:hypothetical protein
VRVTLAKLHAIVHPESTMAIELSKAEYWRDHIKAWRASGLSQRAYCARHALLPHRLSYWSRRPTAPAPTLTLVPLELVSSPGPITLHGSCWRLTFAQPPAADWLAHLLGRLS